MKITAFLVFLFTLHLSAATIAQTVTLSEHKVPLEKVLNDIRQQSGYVFFYNQDWMQQSKPVDLDVKNLPLDQALKAAFKDQPFDYAIVNKTIVLKLKEKPAITPNVQAQAVTVTGKVTNELGDPMPGTNVREKGGLASTITDSKGNFTLNVADNNSVLVFSYIGYETQELAAKNIPAGSAIILKPSSTNLREVIINKGYYSEKQELSTGDVSVVTAKQIESQPITDPIEALKGLVPGLLIQQSSGNPGSYGNIVIRGSNSLTNGNDPLYIVDGVPYDSRTLSSSDANLQSVLGLSSKANANVTGNGIGSGGGISPFNSLNPADIETIEVLKDADATSIYGSRGANGVIIITTKKGQVGDTKVDVNVQTGASTVARQMDLLNTQQYLEMRREAFKNDGVAFPNIATSPSDRNFDIDGVWDTTRYTNWQKVLLGNTDNFTNANVDLSGGTANTQFRIGLGLNSQGTVYPGDYSDKSVKGGFNLTHSSTDQRFHMQFTGQYAYDDNNLPQINLAQLITLAPDAPALYNPDGSINWQVYHGAATWANPLSFTLKTANSTSYNFLSSLVLSYKLAKGLQLQSTIGYRRGEMNQTDITPATAFAPPDVNDPNNRQYGAATGSSETWNIDPQLNYQTKIGKGNLNILLGGSIENDEKAGFAYNAYGFASDAQIVNPLSATTQLLSTDSYSQYRFASLYARLGYTWDDKYLFNVTGRRDGSSRFGYDKEFGNFGSVGAGWIFSKEKFISDNLDWLNYGKLRASYGTSGNDQIGDYQYLSTYSSIGTTYQGITGLFPTSLTNPTFAWELDKKLEGGLDLSFLKDRIDLSVSYFRNRTGNQLVQYNLPSTTGFQSIEYNLPAVVQNTGAEFDLHTINIKNSNFSWSTSFNLTLPTNKLVSFPDIAASSYAHNYEIGQPLSIAYYYQTTGVNPQTGLYSFKTNNTNGIPSYPADDYFVTYGQKFYGGFNNTFRYKRFQLDFRFYFVKQTERNYLFSFKEPGFDNANEPTAVLARWQTPGQSSSIQRFSQSAYNYNYLIQSDAIFSDGSYIRLQNASLSYDLPDTWMHVLHLKTARFYLQGQNLFTITNYLGMDPESGAINLPPLRTITGGIQANF